MCSIISGPLEAFHEWGNAWLGKSSVINKHQDNGVGKFSLFHCWCSQIIFFDMKVIIRQVSHTANIISSAQTLILLKKSRQMWPLWPNDSIWHCSVASSGLTRMTEQQLLKIGITKTCALLQKYNMRSYLKRKCATFSCKITFVYRWTFCAQK